MSEGKQKLTLSVDAATVERAKELGINISDLTEQILRGYAFDPASLDLTDSRKHYLDLLKTMDPLLLKYRTNVYVADFVADPEIGDTNLEGPVRYYGPSGFSIDFIEEILRLDQLEGKDHFVAFLKPDVILKNFIEAIESAKRRRQEEVGSIALAARIVQAIAEADSGTTEKRLPGRRRPSKPKANGRGGGPNSRLEVDVRQSQLHD